jgi:SAM-dependent methyltransferase
MDLESFTAMPDWRQLLRESWEAHASWWQQGFTDGADAEYEEQIVPIVIEWLGGCRRVVDLGGGEGQLLRALGGKGIVVDQSMAQLVTARARGQRVVCGSLDAVPVASGWADGVLVSLVLEHVVELREAIREIARVLARDGRLLLLLNHPILQTPGSGFVDDTVLGERYWRLGPYLREQIDMEEVAAGVFLPFVHRPLSRYVNEAVDAGLVLERMLEPPPPPGFVARAAEYAEVVEFPRLLALVFRRSA